MASARLLSKLVATVASISSGAVRAVNRASRSGDLPSGLAPLPNLLDLVASSLSSNPQAAEDSVAEVRLFIEALVHRYGTVRRAIDALADRRRRHERINVDKARAWSHAMGANPSVIEQTIKHHATLHMQVLRWINSQGSELEARLTEFQDWLDGPLEVESADSDAESNATRTTVSETHESEHPETAVERPETASAALELIQSQVIDDKHISEHHHDRRLTPDQQAAARLLIESSDALDRCVAAIATGEFAKADALLGQLRGRLPVNRFKTLQADRYFYDGRFDDAVPLFRDARTVNDNSQAKLNLAVALMHAHRGMHEEHYKEAIDLLNDVRASESEVSAIWVRALCLLGAAFLYCPAGDRDLNVRRAIEHLETALARLDQSKDKTWWAEVYVLLGVAWQQLPSGKKVENIQRAITCFNRAAENWSAESEPDRWATVQNNLGHAWEALPTGHRAVNLQRAIEYFSAALKVRDSQQHSVSWATIQNNLGNAWAKLPAGDARENVQRAIDCHTAALGVWSAEDRRHEWAATQNNLGNAWALLPAADDEERQRNLRRAISCYKAALQVRTRAASPSEWASTQNNLGSTLLMVPADGTDISIQEAITCFRSALEVRTRDALPMDWAKTQTNLGSAMLRLRKGDRAAHVRDAIKSFESALEVFRPDLYPHQHEHVAAKLREARDGAVRFGG